MIYKKLKHLKANMLIHLSKTKPNSKKDGKFTAHHKTCLAGDPTDVRPLFSWRGKARKK